MLPGIQSLNHFLGEGGHRGPGKAAGWYGGRMYNKYKDVGLDPRLSNELCTTRVVDVS
jgi:hypothetical protein